MGFTYTLVSTVCSYSWPLNRKSGSFQFCLSQEIDKVLLTETKVARVVEPIIQESFVSIGVWFLNRYIGE